MSYKSRFLTLRAPAKVNLYLGVWPEIIARGYHRVDSVMAAVSLYDEVTIAPADELSLTCEMEVDCPPDRNAVWRAAVAMGKVFGREPRFALHVVKRIPTRAGLGGASADAAAVIMGIAKLWELDEHDRRLVEVAAGVGADVPFFLCGSSALLQGAGDVLVERFSTVKELPLVLARAKGNGVSTADAYALFDRCGKSPESAQSLLQALREGDMQSAMGCFSNNLGSLARILDPACDDVFRWLTRQRGAVKTLVSGSGSCVFAVCESWAKAERIAHSVREQGWWGCAVSTISRAQTAYFW